MSVINQNLLLTPEGYQISRSVRLRSSASAYLNRTPASAGNRKTWTWSGWVKRGQLGSTQDIFTQYSGSVSDFEKVNIRLSSSDKINIDAYAFNFLVSTQVFRDPSAWYHIVFAFDTTQATANNRMRLYVNGLEVSAFDTRNNPSLNTDYGVNMATTHRIGANSVSLGVYLDGYLTEVNFVDGQALTPSSFGETDAVTGVWKPKKYAGTYGTNGFYLNFSDNSAATAAAIGKDWSGNGNNWTPNNISVTAGVTYDSMLDVPTMYADGGNGRGNYAVLNPLLKSPNAVVSAANSQFTIADTAGGYEARTSMALPSSGKWYWEITNLTASQYQCIVGIVKAQSPIGASATNYYSLVAGTTVNNALYYTNGVSSGTWSGITTPTGANDVWIVAFDADNRTMWLGRNGTWYNTSGTANPATNTDPRWSSIPTGVDYVPYVSAYYSPYASLGLNFGQRPFAYTPPTGFKALNTQNLPDATIKKGSSYFNTVLYTGNAASQSITGVGFQPDLVWGKLRSTSSYHRLHDALRGADNTLATNVTDAEVSGNGLVSFDADGFTMDSGTNINQAYTYVAWNWKESASAGFDIVTYTGTGSSSTVVNHSLGVKPKMIITKIRSSGSVGWVTTHQSLGTNMSDYYIYLNTTAASAFSSGVWGAEPTSTTFGSSVNIHSATVGATVVAYLFAEVAGYSAFGKYTGNGSTDGPMVFCGFKPRFVMVKGSSNASSWQMFDTSRSTYNQTDNTLWADLSSAEGTGTARIDLLSNGFKVRAPAGTDPNVSSATYIYMAIAENPFKNSLAR